MRGQLIFIQPAIESVPAFFVDIAPERGIRNIFLRKPFLAGINQLLRAFQGEGAVPLDQQIGGFLRMFDRVFISFSGRFQERPGDIGRLLQERVVGDVQDAAEGRGENGLSN